MLCQFRQKQYVLFYRYIDIDSNRDSGDAISKLDKILLSNKQSEASAASNYYCAQNLKFPGRKMSFKLHIHKGFNLIKLANHPHQQVDDIVSNFFE